MEAKRSKGTKAKRKQWKPVLELRHVLTSSDIFMKPCATDASANFDGAGAQQWKA